MTGTMPKIAKMFGGKGYKAPIDDLWRTPAWVTELLLTHIALRPPIWEPAAGEGDMADVLRNHYGSSNVIASDLRARLHRLDFPGMTFLGEDARRMARVRRPVTIVTNPPFKMADDFIRRALEITQPMLGMVAMLLPWEFDAATTERVDIFRDHMAWDAKLALSGRIVWVGLEVNEDGKRAAPRQVHAWYVWDWGSVGQQARTLYP